MASKMEDRDIEQCVQIVIEIGHDANPRTKPAKDGFTHDWTVFVRGQEGCDISHFVEKVVFHLHPTFSNPCRVVTVPPFCVTEMGYGSFDLPIEIFFRNKKEPRKVTVNYSLFLHVNKPVNYVRCEQFTFQKPAEDFMEKLINAGKVLVLPPVGGPPTKQKQPLKSKDNRSKQIFNVSGMRKSGNSDTHISAAVKSLHKRENNSNGQDGASNSSSIMASTLPPLDFQKRTSDYSDKNKQKKTKTSSSVSSEKVRREDMLKSKENQNKDKILMRKDCENKDEAQIKYYKKDINKSSKKSGEEKNESSIKGATVSKFDDKNEVRDAKKKVMDDKKEFKKDVKDEEKNGKDVNNVRNDKNKVIKKVQNYKRDEDNKTSTVDIFCQQRSVGKMYPSVQSSTACPLLSCKMNPPKPEKVISENTLAVKEPTPPKRHQEKTATKCVSEIEVLSLSNSKACNHSNSLSTLQFLMHELEYILADKEHDITAAVNVFSQRKLLAERYSKESQEKSSPCQEELIKLKELEKTLMSIKDVSVLQKVVKLIISSGYFEIYDAFDTELCALSLNLIGELQKFLNSKI